MNFFSTISSWFYFYIFVLILMRKPSTANGVSLLTSFFKIMSLDNENAKLNVRGLLILKNLSYTIVFPNT